MQYTILELERIEKILQAKLEEATDAYDAHLGLFQQTFLTRVERGELPFATEQEKRAAFDKAAEENIGLVFLKGEEDLFKRGINSLYSYWNSAVEIFIDTLREKAEEEFPEKKRYVDPLDPEKLKYIRDNE
ncbi:MAG: hypothetical protein DRQ42_09780 [Gammaproteobacteria bacterium]|nr:MAG: hypothetical protein DRQ42_09780 [Gammaproteobacteria bacterium]